MGEAVASHQLALNLNRALGDRLGQADSLRYLSLAQQEAGDYSAVEGSCTMALELYRDLGDLVGQAHALNNLGAVQLRNGDYSGAAASLSSSLELYQGLAHRLGQAEVLNILGDLLRESDRGRSRAHYEQALSLSRDISALLEEARALEGLATIDIEDEQLELGARRLRKALEIYQRIRSSRAEIVHERLRSDAFGESAGG
jgi:tetratricopeptide (TPR) repeat protein